MTGQREASGAAGREELVVPCPVCRRPARWAEPPRGPFCSERCRLVDLGAWAEGRYAIPGPPLPEEPDGSQPGGGETPAGPSGGGHTDR